MFEAPAISVRAPPDLFSAINVILPVQSGPQK
jgi:hypothetical protein